ncbi:MAG: hypothetical protein JSU73_05190 [candidate division WOR-3 bacterium]|nr:MAG: hypothetical protein JSU73_05190 [candidate division WOR-3 bacterium]
MSSSSGKNVIWTAPDSGCTGVVSVSVSDGRGGTAAADKSITVDASANRPPVIGKIDGPDSLTPGGSAQFTCEASDPDDDSISYCWSCNTGGMSNETSRTVSWRAPDSSCTAALTVIASDTEGGSDTAAKAVCISAAANRPPVIGSVSGPDSVDAGGEASLTCNATDPDGDSLAYSWSTDIGGLSSPSGKTVTWFAPDSSCSATVTVIASDGLGAADTAGKTMGVRPPANRPPEISSISGPSSVEAGGSGQYTCNATDPDGDSLSYFWECDKGRFMSRSDPTTTWYAPDSSGSARIWVTVSDGRGGQDEKTKSVTLTKVTTTIMDTSGIYIGALSSIAFYVTLKAGYTAHGAFSVPQHDITFAVLDSYNYYRWRNNQSCTYLTRYYKSAGSSYSVVIPATKRYYFLLDNTYSLLTPKYASLSIKKTTP